LKSKTVNIVFLIIAIGLVAGDIFLGLPVFVYVILIVVFVSIQAYGSIVLSANFFTPVVVKGSSLNAIAVTFDDGPVPGKTEKILDILKQYEVKGAFFCIGKNAAENPEVVKRIHDDGHILGNHSFFHGKFFDLQTSDSILEELTNTDEVFDKIIGQKPKFFRPPYGVTNPMVANAIRKGKYITVGWTLRSFDTVTNDGNKLLDKLKKEKIEGGDIVLFHDYSESMISVLPEFIKHVRSRGFHLVSLDKLLNEKAYV
jgi:peptidoglycan/xylan/chitin deacetylase (PgdA/CDA1 family)